MNRVLVPLANGFEDIEAITVIDVLRRGGIDVVTASLGEHHRVRSAHGVTVCADALLGEVLADDYAAIVLPGGGEGTHNLKTCPELHARLRRQFEDHLLIAAICAAPTVLAAAGVLPPSVHVTCYPGCEAEMGHPSANVPVVADGLIISGQAPGAAMLFSLVVLQTLKGPEVAAQVARAMVTDVLG